MSKLDTPCKQTSETTQGGGERGGERGRGIEGSTCFYFVESTSSSTSPQRERLLILSTSTSID